MHSERFCLWFKINESLVDKSGFNRIGRYLSQKVGLILFVGGKTNMIVEMEIYIDKLGHDRSHDIKHTPLLLVGGADMDFHGDLLYQV